MYNLPNGEVRFGKERKIISTNISKISNDFQEFKIDEIKNHVLSLVDMIKSEFGLDCVLSYGELEENNYPGGYHFKSPKSDILSVDYEQLENLNDIEIGDFKIIVELT
jgi:hypothetical protein